ncbi:cytochrome b5 domain-containing protein [Clostridium chauvoei]|uniref:Cytochrome b5 heme-binding domain-containing protein n=2 Tax=Clostridium chauvoei TaxID=46867 RepID=A0ABD4RG87_9CLOT|nr:cytochrome b5 domain-containing protein [Clostridium chauvoei]ATD53858.1 hypothetical protein BTM20_00650 [Clostridium chauvoei]ATD58337.1 hypothetical protein BTM21_11665 [Clostridium chauvoei]MBX7280382.1 hypothetical protein [Clostridium chauvoei]MBX7282867.1 hypothetical protein [Clostridium chauvoei]MBX7285273.1 hypothetical protein [Clostridium chauvoei]
MTKKNFLEEKFIELNQLKTILLTYPKDYKESIIDVMSGVCDKVTEYLEDCKKHTFRSVPITNQKFTIEELAKYNGKNGMPAYVAIDNKVYSLENVDAWKNGMHNGLKAGNDLTEFFKSCHEGAQILLDNLELVGELIPTMSRRYRENIIENLPIEYTIEELSKYNGRDGMPSLIAINGTVYDVADVDVWKDGVHFGVMAGKNLTNEFLNCHAKEMDKILEKLRIVGTLIE